MSTPKATSYKARKEAFVSNLSGSSLTDINLVTLVAASAILLWTILQKRQSFFTPYTPVAAVADFLLNVSAILFAITLYSSVPLFLNIFLITPAVLLLVLNSPTNDQQTQSSASKSKQQKKATKSSNTSSSSAPNDANNDASSKPARLPVRPFVTHYRGSMLVVTCLAILAVDFPVFPRRFAKVETWGTSLMDIGVGSFVFSAGVVSARGLIKSEQQSGSARSTFSTRFIQALRHSLPSLVLGFIRLWSVKGLDYAEHVTEYGVHWNFFFTLGFLPPFVELSDTITRKLVRRYEILALLLAVTYELVLNNTDLLAYILVSPRGPDLLSKNREGVFSFIGYLSIFLAGRGTGVFVMQYQDSPTTTTKPQNNTNTKININGPATTATNHERTTVLKNLLIQSLIASLLFLLTTTVYGLNLNVSRRLANLPYTLWIVAFNNAQLLLFGLVESTGPSFTYLPQDAARVQHATSFLLRVFNSNGLAVFLVANLLTGLVNLTLNTLDMPDVAAMAVLVAYAAAVTGVAVALHLSGWKIRL
ncbi:hypothetical protein LTR84_001281 [Exophiala bonariae]|uniref:GPI-anchored wall transfer protein n=1 Tax=Exophiala bonariae TaxID=1690606 RepID=A0AAV9NED8_9EURO|nr:hypothetical protein LTR84_001281 [Exophiala bonariae]